MQSDSIDSLRRSILEDAAETARLEMEQAEDLAAEEVKRARQESEAEQARILREADREAEALRRRIASNAELEAKRLLLEVRETLIREALDRAVVNLTQGIDAGTRRESVLRLVVEAARQVGGGRLTVQTGARDADLLTREFLAEARQRLAREGLSVELTPSDRPAEIAGGAIVTGSEGRVMVDNSFDARLRRQEPALRTEVWRILSGHEGAG